MFKFEVAENHDTIPKVEGVVVDDDCIKYLGKIYPIADKSKSINGCKLYYTRKGIEYDTKLKIDARRLTADAHIRKTMGETLFDKFCYTKIMANKAYEGESDSYRPYRPGLKVRGIIINNQMIIHTVYHHETTGVSANQNIQSF